VKSPDRPHRMHRMRNKFSNKPTQIHARPSARVAGTFRKLMLSAHTCSETNVSCRCLMSCPSLVPPGSRPLVSAHAKVGRSRPVPASRLPTPLNSMARACTSRCKCHLVPLTPTHHALARAALASGRTRLRQDSHQAALASPRRPRPQAYTIMPRIANHLIVGIFHIPC